MTTLKRWVAQHLCRDSGRLSRSRSLSSVEVLDCAARCGRLAKIKTLSKIIDPKTCFSILYDNSIMRLKAVSSTQHGRPLRPRTTAVPSLLACAYIGEAGMPRWLQYCGASMRTGIFMRERGHVGVHTRHLSQHLLRYDKYMPGGERVAIMHDLFLWDPIAGLKS